MTPQEFLRLVLPEQGNYYLALFKKGHDAPAHLTFSDIDVMVEKAEEIAARPDYQVYHACSSYKTPWVEVEVDGTTKKKYRIKDNWSHARSFWVDIDCGQSKADEGKGYLTKNEAAKAVFKFAAEIGWPKPVLVDSGNGLHSYWPLSKDISSAAWVKVAQALKAALTFAKVIADPSRTADFASVLRTPGTFNRKGEPKLVQVKSTCVPQDPAELVASLSAYIKANKVTLPKETSKPAANINADFIIEYPKIDCSIEELANKCQQVSQMRDSKGDIGYEHWRGVIGLAKFCIDGEEKMESWTELRHEKHAQLNWQAKWKTWNSDPTKCDFLELNNPEGCIGCEFRGKGKFKSPIVLGRIIPISVETAVEVAPAHAPTAAPVVVVVPALPTGYSWDGHLLSRLLPDKDGLLHALSFCHDLFYLTSRIRGEDGSFRHGVRMHLPNKTVRDFEISGDAMASTTDMLRALARHELHTSNHKDAGSHMAAYLRDQLKALKLQVDEVSTMTSFGWKDDYTTFLLGETLFTKTGARKVLVGGNAKGWAKFLEPRGSVEPYVKALNFMYNREGVEHWQYAICAGWGTLLTHMTGENLYKGLLLALQGGDTAKGKTTACHSAMYAFGYAPKMSLNSKDGFTGNALWAFLGVYNNLPILMDELTKIEATLFSDISYGVSNGQAKVRMHTRGGNVSFADTAEWQLSPYITGNRDFHGLLASEQANSQAEAVRLIQVNVDRYKPVYMVKPEIDRATLTKEEREALEAEESILVRDNTQIMQNNAGPAGALMIQYMVDNRDAVEKLVRDYMNQLTKQIPSSRYRFYRCHTACTLAAAKIAKDLGIIDFDLDRLTAFTLDMIHSLSESVMETNSITQEEAFSRLISSLANRILVTQEYRDKRDGRGPETPRHRIVGEVAGRYVLGTQKDKEFAGQLLLAQKDVRDWCMKNRTDYNAMLAKLDADGVLVHKSEKLTLTRGTDFPTVQQRCIVVDMLKLDKDAVLPTLTLVSNKSLDEEQAEAV